MSEATLITLENWYLTKKVLGGLKFSLFSLGKDLDLGISINLEPLIELIWNFGERFLVLDPSNKLIWILESLREVSGELTSPTPFLNVIEDAGEINSPKISLTDKFGSDWFWYISKECEFDSGLDLEWKPAIFFRSEMSF